ncbi:alcohol oxidase [Teratosphaeria nubilosa]|uniref:Alcohol oxidase n=1 Tax=Teratosphaeria nubilosa TaxID=161662 RepID=A0A6G1KYS8_9PEZI|nr:alcohol oxidase [Teratosphaeria nubilosa]
MSLITPLIWLLTPWLASAAPTDPSQIPTQGGITSDAHQVLNKTYDYIICGGGLTGLTVASRLTEDPNISVLVIEAGEDHHNDPRVDDVRTYGQAFGSELDHNITSTPVEYQHGARLPLVAGNMLGGSDSLNGASWTKGAASQYDILPLLTGDASWAWKPFNEYMMKAEHFTPPSDEQKSAGAQHEPEFHGTDGLVEVSFAYGIFKTGQAQAIKAAYKVWNGLVHDIDAADGEPNGATIIPDMVEQSKLQHRSSSFTAYTEKQIAQRSNWKILTSHRVTEIIWQSGQDIVADGVRFSSCRDCISHEVKAKREVLLAAGSLQSPQILELSGVGDPDVLAAADVPLKKAMPGVGKHMQEQTKNTIVHNAQSFLFDGTGPPSAIVFPDIEQILESNTSATYDYVMDTLSAHARALKDQGSVANADATLTILRAQVDNLFRDKAPAAEIFFTLAPGTNELGIDLWNLIVLSRGTAHIRSSDPWEHPVVKPNYFGHPLELMIQVAASKQSEKVYKTPPLSDHVKHHHDQSLPGDADHPDNSDKTWEEWVKENFTSVWHYIATLACMKEEYGGVVDGRLRVYGVKNVRAIDASVLPIQLSAHLSSSLYGIAEKAAQMIKEDQT